jgi:hypothetical protein
MLPIADLAKRVSKFGEEFPRMYLFPLRYICPGFSLFLAAMAVSNEIQNPKMSDHLADKIVSYSIFASPLAVTIIIALWNPFKKEVKKEKAEEKKHELLEDSNGEYENFD